MKRFVFLLQVVAFAFFSCTIAPDTVPVSPGTPDALDTRITALLEKELVSGKVGALTAVIVHGDTVLYQKTLGYKDFAAKIAADNHTGFRVGSISKLFTAIAVMQLREQGKLDIDLPIETYLPEFSIRTRFNNDQPITIRSIMTHHSGLPGGSPGSFILPGGEPENYSFILEYLQNEYKAYPTGEILAYSNLAVALLGEIIQRVSGEDYNQYLVNHILDPIGMKQTSSHLDERTSASLSLGYSAGKQPVPYYTIGEIPAGGLMTNAVDITEFMKDMLYAAKGKGSKLLPSSAFREMITRQNADVLLDMNAEIGLNFFLNDPKFAYAGENFYHGGYIPPYMSQFIVFPNADIAVFIATSSDTIGMSPTFGKTCDALIEAALSYAGMVRKEQPIQKAGVVPFSAEDYTLLPGTYATMIGLISIYEKKGNLYLEIGGNSVKLSRLDTGWIKGDPVIAGDMTIDGDKMNVPYFMVLEKNGSRYLAIGTKIAGTIQGQVLGAECASKKLPKPQQFYIGTYELIPNPAVSPEVFKVIMLGMDKISVTYNKGYLFCTMKIGQQTVSFISQYAGSSQGKDEFLIYCMGRMGMETMFFTEENGSTYIKYSGLVYKRTK